LAATNCAPAPGARRQAWGIGPGPRLYTLGRLRERGRFDFGGGSLYAGPDARRFYGGVWPAWTGDRRRGCGLRAAGGHESRPYDGRLAARC